MLSTRIATQIYAKICFETTPGQKKIIEKLSEYLADDDFSRIFVLNGYAGTGKTTLIGALVGALKDLGIKPVLLAPTGRAAKVLAQYAQEKAFTIHKRIYRQRTNADYESKFSLDFNRERGAVFIVDEASMLSDASGGGAVFGSGSLLSRPGGVCPQRPRVPAGAGRRQRAAAARRGPISVRRSIPRRWTPTATSFTARWTRWCGRRRSRASCSTPRWCAACSKTAFTRFPASGSDFPDVEAVEGGEFIEKLQDCYARYGRDETIVITRSNKRANRYNEGIRRNVLCAEEEIESGDMLMVVKNNYYFPEHTEDCPMNFIANGDIARLNRLRRFEDFYGFRFANAVLEFRRLRRRGDRVQDPAGYDRLGIPVAHARGEQPPLLRGGKGLSRYQEQAQAIQGNS